MQPPGGPSGDPYPVPTALQVNADASSSRMPRTAIDPTLLPLADDDDNEDFPDFQSLFLILLFEPLRLVQNDGPILLELSSSTSE